MNEADPIGNDAREARHLRTLGPPPHVCMFCGASDPPPFMKAVSTGWLEQRVPHSMLEEHHVLGRNHDPNSTVILCKPCHFRVTVGYIRAGVDMHYEPDARIRVKKMLNILAVFLEMVANVVRQWSEFL